MTRADLPKPRIAAIIVAAGRGLRAGGDIPKQYRLLAGRPVIAHSLARFAGHEAIVTTIAVINAADRGLYEAAALGLDGLAEPAIGGDSRQASCREGLEALSRGKPDIVLIHDAARPFASTQLIDRAIAAATERRSARATAKARRSIGLAIRAGAATARPSVSTNRPAGHSTARLRCAAPFRGAPKTPRGGCAATVVGPSARPTDSNSSPQSWSQSSVSFGDIGPRSSEGAAPRAIAATLPKKRRKARRQLAPKRREEVDVRLEGRGIWATTLRRPRPRQRRAPRSPRRRGSPSAHAKYAAPTFGRSRPRPAAPRRRENGNGSPSTRTTRPARARRGARFPAARRQNARHRERGTGRAKRKLDAARAGECRAGWESM